MTVEVEDSAAMARQMFLASNRSTGSRAGTGAPSTVHPLHRTYHEFGCA